MLMAKRLEHIPEPAGGRQLLEVFSFLACLCLPEPRTTAPLEGGGLPLALRRLYPFNISIR